ncbi:MAG TPA: site-specific integrase [Pyrinomonadaceae bacterium]|jgi:site-specific recombinase XerD|nr:site-specific integrase [Pyrinomonadaceae bacterium]
MSDATLTAEILPPPAARSEMRAAPGPLRFEERLAAPFILKSLSAEARESYRRGIQEFFRHAGGIHLTQVTQEHVLRYRDNLIRDRRRPATVAQKLSVVRSFFSYCTDIVKQVTIDIRYSKTTGTD